MAQKEKSKHVLVMVPDTSVHETSGCRDEAEIRGSMGASHGPVLKQNVDSETLALNIEQSMGEVGEMLSRIDPKIGETWEIKSVSVGLSINTDGSVGIAAAGLENSLKLKLIPRKKKEDLGF
ncbi:MAG: hypothetical protein M0T73_15560 [Deltaproteobacteria bacterium]|nr:hypothetical protein [Deltaproteobacteria bacterium]